jgi:hypothetical protein
VAEGVGRGLEKDARETRERTRKGRGAQVINYLNATGMKLGLLVNFGHYPKLEWERIVSTRDPTKYAKHTK